MITSGIVQLDFNVDDLWLFTQDALELSIWDLSTSQKKISFPSRPSGPNSFSLSGDGSILAFVSGNEIQLLDAHSLQLIEVRRNLPHTIGKGNLISISPQNNWLAEAGCTNFSSEMCIQGEISMWEGSSKSPHYSLNGLKSFSGDSYYTTLAFSYDDSILAAGNNFGLHLWNLSSRERIPADLSIQDLEIYYIEFVPDSDIFIVFSNKGIIKGKID